jgi:hypothetical protein
MFGFLIGTACLIGLFCTLKRGRRFGGHCGHRGWHGESRGDSRYDERGGFGRSTLMRWLFERLDTTPGQERVMRTAVDDFIERARAARREVEDSRRDVARAMRSESFDAEALGEAFAKHDSALGTLRNAGVEGLAKIHEALDEKQRARLAELIESGMGRRWHGPYRSVI